MAHPRHNRLLLWLLPLTLLFIGCKRIPPPPNPPPPPPPSGPNAPTGFDNQSNGLVSDSIHDADRDVFDEVEDIADGLGPIYNAQSCRECHQNPVSGAGSQITELRVGHLGPDGRFRDPDIPIGRGTDTIPARTLVNDRAICPNATFPDSEIQERVEAVADDSLVAIGRRQRQATQGKIHGQALAVPLVEAPGHTRIGRFGWKDQQASLLSFAGDAYLNEMGITSRLFPDEVTTVCNTATEPNDQPGPDGLADVDHFARFMRALKAPARDSILAATDLARQGSALFDSIGCATCHVPTMVTEPAGTIINGGTDTIPPALGAKTFHPFGDFLLHDVGTGDGIVMAVLEHYGKRYLQASWRGFSVDSLEATRTKVRTASLWGLRLRSRLMHDGASLTFRDAIVRHRGEASAVTNRFLHLTAAEQKALVTFLESL
jgi:CxxC motif-containing protein (DUF1111 family)